MPLIVRDAVGAAVQQPPATVTNQVNCRSDELDAIATVTFVSERLRKTARVALVPGKAPTLLTLARQHGVPILFTCATGGCGACVVRVTPTTDATASVALTESEAFLLPVLAGRQADASDDARSSPASGCLRLACQYVVGPGNIAVAFSDAMAAG